MINVNLSTVIHKSVQHVFDYVSKPENDFQWQYGTLETARISDGDNNSGTSFRSIGHLMGHRNLSTFEVAEFETNKKYSIKSISGPLDSRTSYSFEKVNGGTKINVSTQASVADFKKMNEGLVEKSLRRQLKENLALLKGLLEANPIMPASKTDPFSNRNMI